MIYTHMISLNRDIVDFRAHARQNLQQKSRSQALPKLVSQHDNSGSVTGAIADERPLVGYSGI